MSLLVGVVITALMTAAATPAAADRTETKTYIAVIGDAVVACGDELGLGTGIGGACFDVLPGETRASVSINDQTTNPSSGFYCYEENPGDPCNGEQVFCSSIVEVAIPPGSTRLVVFIDGPVFGNPALSPCGLTFSAGTTGTITVTFS